MEAQPGVNYFVSYVTIVDGRPTFGNLITRRLKKITNMNDVHLLQDELREAGYPQALLLAFNRMDVLHPSSNSRKGGGGR